jgi:hypothetical protein
MRDKFRRIFIFAGERSISADSAQSPGGVLFKSGSPGSKRKNPAARPKATESGGQAKTRFRPEKLRCHPERSEAAAERSRRTPCRLAAPAALKALLPRIAISWKFGKQTYFLEQ